MNQITSARTAKNTQKDAFFFPVCRRSHILKLSHLPHRMNYKYKDSAIKKLKENLELRISTHIVIIS